MSEFQKALGYEFENGDLLAEALTHPSMKYESQRAYGDNQRLEFLGDAVLQLVLTEKLYEMFPKFSEGRLTKLRARLVSRDALQQYSRSLGVGEHIQMSKGEEASGGRDRASTLADVFESITGAIYLDGGMEPARKMILRVSSSWVNQVEESPDEKNPKGQLQEVLQSIAPESPFYEVLSEQGPDHDKSFAVAVLWKGEKLGEGRGNTKKSAAAAAAKQALEAKLWVSVSVEP